MSKTQSKPITSNGHVFKIWNDGEILSGSAMEILKSIHGRLKSSPKNHPEVSKMNLSQYISAVIDDAKYMVPEDLLKGLHDDYEQNSAELALACLTSSATSRMKIMSIQ